MAILIEELLTLARMDMVRVPQRRTGRPHGHGL